MFYFPSETIMMHSTRERCYYSAVNILGTISTDNFAQSDDIGDSLTGLSSGYPINLKAGAFLLIKLYQL